MIVAACLLGATLGGGPASSEAVLAPAAPTRWGRRASGRPPRDDGCLGGASLIAAQLTNDSRFRRFAYSLAQAQIVDTTLKVGLKAAVSRTRPNAENNNAFPSGHTSTTFAFATVAAHHYGKKVSIPVYAVATLVGLSRIQKGKHFPSDVVFGAVLGYIAGRTAVRGRDQSLNRQQITFLPVVGWGRTGLAARVVF